MPTLVQLASKRSTEFVRLAHADAFDPGSLDAPAAGTTVYIKHAGIADTLVRIERIVNWLVIVLVAGKEPASAHSV